MKNAIIIGAGFGGLALAIRLQNKGFQVALYEKNDTVGGHAVQLKKKGYTFDMGPSLITAPDIIEKVFKTAGKSMKDYLELIYLDPFYRLYFHDKTFIDYSADAEKMKEQMARFNRKDAEKYDRFMDYTKQLYQKVIVDGMGSQPFDTRALLRFLPQAVKLRALQSAHGVVAGWFKDERHRFMFSFHPLFIGGSPFRAPAVYLMIPYLEKHGGVWYAKGGMYSLVQALEKVALESGVEIHTSAEVEKVVVEEGRAKGIVVNGRVQLADLVVSNAHFAHTHLDLIRPEARKKWTDKKVKSCAYSMSSFLIYLGVRKKYPELRHHTLILSRRYKELVKDIFDHKILPDDFSMYLHVPSRTDPDMAPADSESMYVLVPTANLASGIDWQKTAKPFAEKILRFLEDDFGLKELNKHIEVLEIFTPDDFRKQRNNYLGSAWGLEPKLTQSASFRPGNRDEDVRGLYRVGASTHPGAGVPGVLLTAEATEKAISEDFNV